jgi:hypothetical protein
MMNVNEAIRSSKGSRKLLRGQSAALRAFIKDAASHRGDDITSTAETLRKHYRDSLILSIEVSQYVVNQAYVLIEYDPAGAAKLWEEMLRLRVAHQKVAELLKTVVKEK